MLMEHFITILGTLAQDGTRADVVQVLCDDGDMEPVVAHGLLTDVLAHFGMTDAHIPQGDVFALLWDQARYGNLPMPRSWPVRVAYDFNTAEGREVYIWIEQLRSQHRCWQAYMSLNPWTGEVTVVDNEQ